MYIAIEFTRFTRIYSEERLQITMINNIIVAILPDIFKF